MLTHGGQSEKRQTLSERSVEHRRITGASSTHQVRYQGAREPCWRYDLGHV
jgi:hypothetical protein